MNRPQTSLFAALTMCFAVAICCSVRTAAAAENLRLEASKGPPPAKSISPEIARGLLPEGLKVSESGGQVVCELWLAKEWAVQPAFKPSLSVLNPLEMGEFLGIIQFPRKSEDFRGQEIPAGVYVMRFGLQPVDGNHVGTSDTRDFVLLVPAADDRDPKTVSKDALFKQSKKASGTAHPAIFTLLPVDAGSKDPLPALRHDADRDLWSVRFKGKTTADGKQGELVVEMVVMGVAAE